jgi:hypothetical protein
MDLRAPEAYSPRRRREPREKEDEEDGDAVPGDLIEAAIFADGTGSR